MVANGKPAKVNAVPRYSDFYWPVIRALKEKGGSASIAELGERVVADMNLSEDVLAVPHGDGTTSEVEYRLAWARTYLKKVGAIDNSERGIWALTSKGRGFAERDAADVARQVRLSVQSRAPKQSKPKDAPPDANDATADESEIGWKEKLLAILKSMPPCRPTASSACVSGYCARAGLPRWKLRDARATAA